MTADTITERVRRGAMLLDASVPGWAQRIDDRDLNIRSCSRCALGQVYGGYEDGMDALFPETNLRARDIFATAHGFEAATCFIPASTETEMWARARAVDDEARLLAAAWLLEIRARLHVAPEPADLPAWATEQNAPAMVP